MVRLTEADRATVRALAEGRATSAEFLERVHHAGDLSSLALAVLTTALREEHAANVAHGLLLAFRAGVDLAYVEVFIALLDAAWHQCHEDLAFELARLRPTSCVEVLYRTARRRFEYLAYDDSLVLASKCIWGLGNMAIDGVEAAREKLHLLCGSAEPLLRDYALEQLLRTS